MSDIFLSYAHDDRVRAEQVADALGAIGWSVWWDNELLAGEAFGSLIEKALGTARAVVVLWSKSSRGSTWVLNEVNFAQDSAVPVLPVLIESCKPPIDFYDLHTESLVDWNGDKYHAGFSKLVDALKERIGAPEPTTSFLSGPVLTNFDAKSFASAQRGDRTHKNIAVFCDTTGGEGNATNVSIAYRLALQSSEQVTFYVPGSDTSEFTYNMDTGGLYLGAPSKRTGLLRNVALSYRLLMNCYEPGDELFLFGFSRGAFVARALSGMLQKCGLLDPEHVSLIEPATEFYLADRNTAAARDFKKSFSRPCPVRFLGVWEAVDSDVLNSGGRFRDEDSSLEVEYAYHALALDERRKDFPPCLWKRPAAAKGQIIEQVWFAGVHADVGGWYDERGLSNIALQWMMDKAVAAGLNVDEKRRAQYVPDPHDYIHESYDGYWRFRGSRLRPLEPGALIHSSVVERMKRRSNEYYPKNLPASYTVVS